MPEPDRRKRGSDPPNKKHHDVFISYAQLDKPIADAICAKLESRRIRCWIAPRDVPPAREFPAAIIEGIEQAKFLVLVFSSHANNSPHVIRELTNAVNKGRIIIPFRIEDVIPSKSMEYLISVPHWLDAITPPLEKHIDELADSIQNILATERGGDICGSCGAFLSPQAKFCESCGIPVPTEPEEPPAAPAPPSPPPPPLDPPAAQPPPQGPPPGPAESVLSPPAAPAPAGPRLKGKTALIAGAAVLGIAIIAIVFFMMSNIPGIPANFTQKTASPTPTTTTPVDYRSAGAPVNLVTLTVEPTYELPKERALFIEVSKDPTNALITVQYNGGPGGTVVQANTVVLTRSDGTAETGKLDFSKRLSEIEFQGTRGTDRIKVIVDMGPGKLYTVVDKLLPFRQRNVD